MVEIQSLLDKSPPEKDEDDFGALRGMDTASF
jgi:hypothetical protein